MKVLLVDDSIGNLSSLEGSLSEGGHMVVRTWDPEEAKRICLSDGFDVIIASVLCVPIDGVSLCIECKRNAGQPLATVLCSPYPLRDEEVDFLRDIGIDHVLQSDELENMNEIIVTLAENPGLREVCNDFDEIRLMGIVRRCYDSALVDLASRAKKLEEILENSSDVIYELDPYGRIILISKAIEKLTGYTRQELMGMSALDVTSADSVELVADHISRLIAGEEDPAAVEVGVQAKDGHVIPAEMIVRPIWHENQVSGILGIGRNVEERKRLEESLRRAMNEKEFYLDLMAHDIQNFNQAIVGYLEMILATEDLDQSLERYARGAFRQVMQIAQLIAHIKRVAQIRESGRERMAIRDLSDVLQRSITKLQSRLDKSMLAITLDCPQGRYPILAGEDIYDLLDLLVSSAMRYSVSDLLHLRVSVAPEMMAGKKYWRVELSGSSFKLSEPVVRCVMSTDYSGCQAVERPDLQLLVVRAIVETQGGDIETKNGADGRGDCFVIRFPQAEQ